MGQPTCSSNPDDSPKLPEIGPCGHFRHLQHEFPMMECSFSQVWAGELPVRKQPTSKVMIPFDMDGIWVSALIDSGCVQTLVCQGFVKISDPLLGVIQFQFIHRNGKPYPSFQVTMIVDGVMRVLMVGLAPRLAHPIILGHD